MKIIEQRRTEEYREWSREYLRPDGESGYSFACSEDGTLIHTQMSAAAVENRTACENGTNGTRYCGVREWAWAYTHPAVGECEVCGREVILDGFTCPCECGADYNSGGQRLAPRSQWGEETGETASDILVGGPLDW